LDYLLTEFYSQASLLTKHGVINKAPAQKQTQRLFVAGQSHVRKKLQYILSHLCENSRLQPCLCHRLRR